MQIMSFNREGYGFTESGVNQTPALHFATFHGDDGNELPVDGNTAMRARPSVFIASLAAVAAREKAGDVVKLPFLVIQNGLQHKYLLIGIGGKQRLRRVLRIIFNNESPRHAAANLDRCRSVRVGMIPIRTDGMSLRQFYFI